MPHFRRSLAAVLFTVAFVPAASAAAPDAERSPRVTIVGASVSAGFIDSFFTGGDPSNDSLPLADVARAWWPNGVVTSRPNLFMFKAPVAKGRPQITGAISDRPDVVLAVDFMFWFGYGPYGTSRRLAIQKKGLALLEKLGDAVPIIVGDYPDMAGASTRMLPLAVRPDARTLAELNKRLRAWAATRKNVTVFPLAKWIAHVKQQGYVFRENVGSGGCRRAATSAVLLHKDRLHASKLGVLALGIELQPALPFRLLRPARWLSAPKLGKRLGVLAELESLPATGKPCRVSR